VTERRVYCPGSCRRCGCTDDRACQTEDGPCFWVEDDLCSACATDEEIDAYEDTHQEAEP
jgi:hypothetical protein